ncbi:MAG: adenylate/guanylate cyclase domain-containing protein [Pseudomonadota bacterium]
MTSDTPDNKQRRLGAILFADVAGYSSLMGDDELATYDAIKTHLDTFERYSSHYQGQVLEVRGDGVFALFDSVVNAVRFSMDVQKAVDAANEAVPEDRRIRFRIGVNLGEVLKDEKQIFGDSVNIAARIEGLAEPGGVCVSGAVYEQIKNKLRYGYEYLGPQSLKNIRGDVEIFRVRDEVQGATMAASPRSVMRGSGLVRSAMNLPSVVVLPFINLGGDPSEQWFSDGITEDIITNLSKFHSLFVIARSSAFAYKNKTLSPQQAAKELGVRYVTQGSIRKAGDRVRISVELADAESGRTIWAEHYDRVLDDIFAVQDEIAFMIVGATAAQIETREAERLRQLMPNDLEAYGLVLQGQQRIFRYTRDANYEARKLYEAAMQADPRYARAMAAVSRTLNLDWRYQWSESQDEALDKALELAQQAALTDESDARGFGELGFVHLYRKEHDAAIRAYTRALTLNPNDADLMSDMADAMAHSGQSEKAIELLQKAMRLNPFYPDQYLWHLGGAYFNLKRYDEAVDTLLYMHNPTEGRRLLAACYGQMGKLTEAQDQAAKVLEAHPNFSLERWASVQPDKFEDDVEHFVEGLKKAGLK